MATGHTILSRSITLLNSVFSRTCPVALKLSKIGIDKCNFISRCVQVSSTSLHSSASSKRRHNQHPLCPDLSGHSRHFHTSPPTQDLMEFFDRKDVWGESSVPHGRPYRLDELRLKSNQDLHKLWYVLLKERNMLMTMEAEYNRLRELFPSPERIAKVEESMENILAVVKERDGAVSMLETGIPGPEEGGYVRDFLGRMVHKKYTEHLVPPHMNKIHRLLHPRAFHKLHLKYLPLWREKLARYRWHQYRQQVKKNRKLEKRFPHLRGKLTVEKPEEPKVS